MVTYRKALPEERRAYIDFADMVFTDNGTSIHFDESIPKVYGEHLDTAYMQNIAIDDEKGIRGLVAVMPNELYAGGETLKIGYIGTVSVHPQARGEGHMKKLMKMCTDEMLSADVDIALLSGQRQRYEYFGYSKGGVAYTVEISMANIRHALKDVDASGITFEEIDHESRWVDSAFELFEQRPVRYRRRRDEFVDCCRNYLGRFWAVLDKGEFVGYIVCHGENDSFAEMYTVSTDAFDAAIKGWMTMFGVNRVSIVYPEWEKEILRHVANYAESMRIQHKLQCSVFNPRKVIGAMLKAKAAYTSLADGEICLEIEGDRFTVAVQDGEVSVKDGGENAVVLDRLEASRFIAYPFEYEGRPKTPFGWFPLPLFSAEPDAF